MAIRTSLTLMALVLGACSTSLVDGGESNSDASPPIDADASQLASDSGSSDSGSSDSGSLDSGSSDSRSLDSGPLGGDASMSDGGSGLDVSPPQDSGTSPDAGCVAKTCLGLGLNCGDRSDDCGGTLHCGSCSAPEWCGGSGTANVCGGCDNLSPGASAAANLEAIQGCLDLRKLAHLNPGTYPVSGTLSLPDNAVLQSKTATRATIVLQTGTAANTLVAFPGSSARVSSLVLDGNNAYGNPNHCCDAVVSFGGGNGNRVEACDLRNATLPPSGAGSTGAYFICTGCTGNVVDNSEIYNLFYGVIFRDALTQSLPNRVSNTRIHDIKCDGITFAGYGEAVGNTIFHNGFDCENPPGWTTDPIPGGGIYTLNNDRGGLIRGNEVYDVCGNGLDLVDGSGFLIEDNDVHDPGYTWGGARPYCGGAYAVIMVGMRNSTLRNNRFLNSARPTNRIGNCWNTKTVYTPSGGAAFADVPGGSNAVISVLLAKEPPGRTVTGNTFENNQMVANCASPCLGVGWFATRGTGWDAVGTWAPSMFTGNSPVGSNYGSKRCGGNWYAGNTASCPGGSSAPCNADDAQHEGAGHDQFRNDNCGLY